MEKKKHTLNNHADFRPGQTSLGPASKLLGAPFPSGPQVLSCCEGAGLPPQELLECSHASNQKAEALG